MYRQGDILIMKTGEEINEAEEVPLEENSIVLAHGEATGHKHQIKDIKNCSFVKSKNDNRFFILITNTVELTHEEHHKITLPTGKYQVVRQREYIAGEIRVVAD